MNDNKYLEDYRLAGKLIAIAIKNNFQTNINFAAPLF
jgi:hypothetical protein